MYDCKLSEKLINIAAETRALIRLLFGADNKAVIGISCDTFSKLSKYDNALITESDINSV